MDATVARKDDQPRHAYQALPRVTVVNYPASGPPDHYWVAGAYDGARLASSIGQTGLAED
ncbi:hypothetical protein GCM10027610_080710 [Dactylosporangium cerinum]